MFSFDAYDLAFSSLGLPKRWYAPLTPENLAIAEELENKILERKRKATMDGHTAIAKTKELKMLQETVYGPRDQTGHLSAEKIMIDGIVITMEVISQALLASEQKIFRLEEKIRIMGSTSAQ